MMPMSALAAVLATFLAQQSATIEIVVDAGTRDRKNTVVSFAGMSWAAS